MDGTQPGEARLTRLRVEVEVEVWRVDRERGRQYTAIAVVDWNRDTERGTDGAGFGVKDPLRGDVTRGRDEAEDKAAENCKARDRKRLDRLLN